MDRQYYLDLAASGLTMPVAAHVMLHAEADPERIVLDGARLGRVIEQTARRFATPLAFPLMDLELEKACLLTEMGIPQEAIPTYHFTVCPAGEVLATLPARLAGALTPRMQANIAALRYIATATDLLPVGMCIGPFSLMTKLVTDPITPVAMAGAGLSAENDEEIGLVECALEMAIQTILPYLEAQIAAGAKAIFVAEPAANRVYLSPNQMAEGADIFERYVMRYARRVKALLDARRVDLIFHCCGEITPEILTAFTTLDPAVLSLGSSRTLWEDAALVPKTTVLFGNLPSKQFYSDGLITVDEVERRGRELRRRMADVGHPFILGTECDVLSVPGCEETIMAKVEMLARISQEECACG